MDRQCSPIMKIVLIHTQNLAVDKQTFLFE